MSKYLNKKVEVDNIVFDSKKEARHYLYLREMEKAGIVKNLQRQVKFDLKVNNVLICKYIADFVYEDGRGVHVVDIKSEMTKKLPVFRLKQKLMKAIYNIEIEIV